MGKIGRNQLRSLLGEAQPNNSYGNSTATSICRCFGDANSMSAQDKYDLTTETGFSTSGAARGSQFHKQYVFGRPELDRDEAKA